RRAGGGVAGPVAVQPMLEQDRGCSGHSAPVAAPAENASRRRRSVPRAYHRGGAGANKNGEKMVARPGGGSRQGGQRQLPPKRLTTTDPSGAGGPATGRPDGTPPRRANHEFVPC